jgi:signal transduction histidine kinase
VTECGVVGSIGQSIARLAGRAREAALSRRPALSWAALALSVSCHAVAVLLVRASAAAAAAAAAAGPEIAAGWVLGMPPAFAACLAGSLLLTIAMFVVRASRLFRMLLGPRVLLLGVLLALPHAARGLDMILTLPLLLEIAIAERFPLNLGVCLVSTAAAAAVGLLVRSGGAAAAAGSPFPLPDWVAVAVLLSVAGSLMLHYRERVLHLEGERRRLDAAVGELARANLGFQEYATVLEQRTMVEERKRITRDIHDIIGYTLTNNIMMMEAAVEMVRRDPDRVSTLMGEARRSAEEGLDGIRTALHLLRAQEDPRLAGIDLIQRLAENFHQATGVAVRLEYGNTAGRLGRRVEEMLFFVIREALTNSFRHGRATLVEVLFWLRDDGMLVVNIRDNGGGAMDIHEGIGITGMRERAQAVGGSLRLGVSPLGVTVTVEAPSRGEERLAAGGGA